MISGSGSPYGYRRRPAWLTMALVALGLFILVVFIVDKLVLQPADTAHVQTTAAAVVSHLDRRDVRHVTVPAHSITIELNDGTRLTAAVPADRDLWPSIRRSGADVTIAPSAGAETPVIAYVLDFVPFVIMALLLLFVLNRAQRRPR
jgi:ATP-dependent Zn protease